MRVEQAVSALADDGFSPVYLRNATAYGVSRRLRADIVVNDLVGCRHHRQGDDAERRIGVAPARAHRRHHAAFAACLDAPREAIHDQAFNVGRNGENYQIRDVANLVAEVVPDCEVAFAGGASADTRNYRVDFSQDRTELPGLRPMWTLRDGIEELYQAYVAAGLTV